MDDILNGVWGEVEALIEMALVEDHASDDVTTQALIPPDIVGKADILCKANGVLAGLDVAEAVFRHVDSALSFEALKSDGSKVQKGDIVAAISGKVAAILRGERTALNFLCRLSGIATETARYVEAVAGTKARIADTRKTAPGMRSLEKYAVRMGGGLNHRPHLGGWVLIKDNHLAALPDAGVGDAVGCARGVSSIKVEVEVTSVADAEEALDAGADIVMLDNMSLEDMGKVVGLARSRAVIEASGGVTLENVRSIAEAGVDLISVGAITHSAKALDLSLGLEPR